MNVLQDLFTAVLNMSITASYAAIGVILVRLLLKKAPKIFSYVLWAPVLFRLVCPISFAAVFSLLRLINPNVQQGKGTVEFVPQNIGLMQNPAIQSGFDSIDNTINTALPQAIPAASINPVQIWLAALSLIWISGVIALLIYSIVSYAKIKRKLQTATLVEGNVFETEAVGTALVCGFIRPKIYVPVNVGDADLSYLLEHERTHIRRRDYLIKPFAFLALILHWFNPLMWLSFALMSRDMEMSCDESVLRRLGDGAKSGYSGSLLSLSQRKRLLTMNPLAFGESHVKARIKNVLHYKRPAFWFILIAIAVVGSASLIFAANPKETFDLEKTKAEAMVFSTRETDLLKIGEAAFDHYHSSFMGEDIPEEYRITSYKLNDISLFAGDKEEFCVHINSNYSTTGLYFMSANGSFKPTDTGYECEENNSEFRIKSLGNNEYQIVSIGTGGGGQGLLPADRADQKTFVEDSINTIMSTPKESSNLQDYIDAHQTEYNAILALDINALPYLFTEFEKGGQTGLKGHIMVNLCRDILSEEDIKYAATDPQDWYDTYKTHVLRIRDLNSTAFIKNNYPKSYILLWVTGAGYDALPVEITWLKDNESHKLEAYHILPNVWNSAIYDRASYQQVFYKELAEEQGSPQIVPEGAKILVSFFQNAPQEVAVIRDPFTFDRLPLDVPRPYADLNIPFDTTTEGDAVRYTFPVEYDGNTFLYYVLTCKWQNGNEIELTFAVQG